MNLPRPIYTEFESKVDDQYHAESYRLTLPRYKFSHGNGQKLLLILDRACLEDIKSRRLLDNTHSGVVFKNIFGHLLPQYPLNPSELLVANYHNCRQPRDIDRKLFRKRLDELVARYRPTHIVLMGRDVALEVYAELLEQAPKLDDVSKVLGRFNDISYGKLRIPTMVTFSLGLVSSENEREEGKRSKDDDTGAYNLIGHLVTHLGTALHGKNRYTLDLREFQAIAIDTLDKFKDFFQKLKRARIVSCDTETVNLNRLDNNINTIQFAFDGQIGYYLPLFHPKTPFTPKELAYIVKKLAWWFSYGKCKYMIFVNAKFDILRIKQTLGISFFKHDIYDIQAAEFCLEESRIARRGRTGIPPYSLDQLTLEYGSWAYVDGKGMGKDERSNTSQVELSRLGRYGCLDTAIPFQIHQFQIREAKRRGPKYSKFLTLLTKQISDMIHAFVNMETNGLLVDRQYLLRTMSPNSVFRQLQEENLAAIRACPSVQKTNALLLKQTGVPQRSLFSGGMSGPVHSWEFAVSKLASQQALFFQILGLKPLARRKDGGGKVDKHFQKRYADIKEVKLFTDYQNLSKLNQTYIIGFYNRLSTDPDMKIDNCLRPSFEYFVVLTGRASAHDPSLHQIPEHGARAKFIKRQFIAPPGELFIKADFQVHEIRNWAIISLEDMLAKAFLAGMFKRREYRLLKSLNDDMLRDWGKTFVSIDLHRQNYQFFFNKPAENVSPDERQQVKAIVFGILYGKGAGALARDIKSEVPAARKLIDLMFSKFDKGGDWLKATHRMGQETCKIVSPVGRVRHLWGYLHWDNSVHAAMNRQSPNSLIQGVSSDEAFKGARNLQKLIWNLFEKQGQPITYKSRNMIHDATEGTAAAIDIPLACYLLEHAYITLVHKEYRKLFGINFNVGLEMDMDIGPCLSEMKKGIGSPEKLLNPKGNPAIEGWDYRMEGQLRLIEEGLKWANEELGYDQPIAKIMRKVQHNAEIISKLRAEELKHDLEAGEVASEYMLMSSEESLSMGLKFALPAKE